MYDIIYDVDDCLLDTNGYISKKLGIDIKKFSNWGLTEMSPREREAVFNEYYIADNYLQAKAFDGVEQLSKFNWDIKLHTGCANLSCGIAKVKRLHELGFDKKDIFLDYHKEKKMKHCLVQVEDGFENLSRSTAIYKILIDKPWNRHFKIRPKDRIYRVESLLEANKKLAEIMYMHNFEGEQEVKQWMI